MSPLIDQPMPEEEAQNRLQDLLKRAEQGDQVMLPHLRQLLDANPQAWQRIGDLGQQAQEAWLRLITGSNLLFHESLVRQVEQMRTELAGPAPSRLVRLLVERVVVCWLQTQYADTLAAQTKDAPPAQHTALTRRQSVAQARYLEAVKCLATVRDLLQPGSSPDDLYQAVAKPGQQQQAKGFASARLHRGTASNGHGG